MTSENRPVSDKEEVSGEVKTRLIVMGYECPAEEISRILGIAPSKTWVKGERVLPEASNVHRENGWVLKSPVDPKATTVEDSIEVLLTTLPDLGAFERLPVGTEIQMTCTIYAYRDRPSVYLPPQIVSRLARIGASLDVDIYDLSERE
jgi:hypothetical protein